MLTLKASFAGALLALSLLPAVSHAGTAFTIDSALALDSTGFGYGSDFTIGTGTSKLDLVAEASSFSSLSSMDLYFKVGEGAAADYNLVDLAKQVSAQKFVTAAGVKTLTYSYENLQAGTYAFNVFGAAGGVVKVLGQSTVSSVPEAEVVSLFAAGALVAGMVVRRRRV
jgi:hypothetical protein